MMYLTTIKSRNDDGSWLDATGKTLFLVGNLDLFPGDTVATDGKFIFGRQRYGEMPSVWGHNSAIVPIWGVSDATRNWGPIAYYAIKDNEIAETGKYIERMSTSGKYLVNNADTFVWIDTSAKYSYDPFDACIVGNSANVVFGGALTQRTDYSYEYIKAVDIDIPGDIRKVYSHYGVSHLRTKLNVTAYPKEETETHASVIGKGSLSVTSFQDNPLTKYAETLFNEMVAGFPEASLTFKNINVRDVRIDESGKVSGTATVYANAIAVIPLTVNYTSMHVYENEEKEGKIVHVQDLGDGYTATTRFWEKTKTVTAGLHSGSESCITTISIGLNAELYAYRGDITLVKKDLTYSADNYGWYSYNVRTQTYSPVSFSLYSSWMADQGLRADRYYITGINYATNGIHAYRKVFFTPYTEYTAWYTDPRLLVEWELNLILDEEGKSYKYEEGETVTIETSFEVKPLPDDVHIYNPVSDRRVYIQDGYYVNSNGLQSSRN